MKTLRFVAICAVGLAGASILGGCVMKSKYDKTVSMLQQSEAELKANQAQLSQCRKDADAAKADAAKAAVERARAEENLSAADGALETQKGKYEALLKTAEDAKTIQAKQIESLQADRDKAVKDAADAQTALRAVQGELNKALGAQEKLQKNLQELQAEVDRLKASASPETPVPVK